VVASVAAILLTWYALLRRRIAPWPLFIGALGLLALLGVLLAAVAPGDPQRAMPTVPADRPACWRLGAGQTLSDPASTVPAMEQRVSLITLGVRDVQRARAFYEQLGWRGQEVQETVFIQTGGSVVVLWGRDKLAQDCGLTDNHVGGFGGIALAHNVRSRDEVDQVVAQALDAGATVTKPAAETFYGGYAAVFTDPDGHPWEIAHNPGFTLGDDGSLTVPDFAAG